jgi:hypothetical protein
MLRFLHSCIFPVRQIEYTLHVQYMYKKYIYSTGTILEKDAYFQSLMDRHTSRLIFCKMISYTFYYHLSPVVEFSHGACCLFTLFDEHFHCNYEERIQSLYSYNHGKLKQTENQQALKVIL